MAVDAARIGCGLRVERNLDARAEVIRRDRAHELDGLACLESADTNNDGTIDISDGIYLLSWLFTGGPEPAPPGPSTQPYGMDLDRTGGPGDLGCDEYLGCK